MPKPEAPPSLVEYLRSPTLAQTQEFVSLPTPGEPLQRPPPLPLQAPPPPLRSPDNMEVLDSMETQKGLDALMHAPNATMLQEEEDDIFLIALAAVTESASEAVAVSPRFPNLQFTLPLLEGFPIMHCGLPAEFLINLHPETVKAWQAMTLPKFFVRFYDYEGKDGTSQHAGLVVRLQKSLAIIASQIGTAETPPYGLPPDGTSCAKSTTCCAENSTPSHHLPGV